MDRAEKQKSQLNMKQKELEARLEEFENESKRWKEFGSVIDQVEESGANYLALMKGIKSKMSNK